MITQPYIIICLLSHMPQALLAESLGSMEAAEKLLTESLGIVAETKKRQQQLLAATAPKAPAAPVYGPAVKPVFLKANPRLSVQQPPR